jgi:uncharacterized protein
MAAASCSFQAFVKPAGEACNLACRYCYYLGKGPLGPGPRRISTDLLESYIAQHIVASPDEVIRFSWHGGEPTVLGVGFFREVVRIQRRLCPPGRTVANGLQTNGTLLDEEWGRFMADEGFSVGLSLDGPEDLHDRNRLSRDGRPTFAAAMRGYETLVRHGVGTDFLCVVGAANAGRPADVYGSFKAIGASFVTFLPLVEPRPGLPGGVSAESVPAEAWGDFLCVVFDEWVSGDIGRIKVHVIEEAARTAFGQEHSLCIFRPVCGDVPVVEWNGDFYSCDHYVDEGHRVGNIRKTPLIQLLEHPAQRAFGLAKRETLPRVCRECEVRDMCNGECPKNRFLRAPDGEPGLNYLCEGYKKFFTRARPFVEAVAAEWRQRNSKA